MFPFQQVVESLARFRQLEAIPGGVRWLDGDGYSELTLRSLETVTHDGYHVDEEVTLMHYSSALSGLSVEEASALNRLATCAAFLPGAEDQPGRFVSRLRVLRGDTAAAEYAYGPMMYIQAAMIGQHAALLARGISAWDPERSVLVGPNERCAIPAEDFSALVSHLDQMRLAHAVDPHAGVLTTELPWDPGAYSAACRNPSFAAELRRLGFTDERIKAMAGRSNSLALSRTV